MVEIRWRSLGPLRPHRRYVALATYLPLRRRRDIIPVLRLNGAIRSQLAETKGLLGYSLRSSLLGGKLWTLSLWTDGPASEAFVRVGPHRRAMAALAHLIGPDAVVTRWSVRGSDGPPSWADALQHLELQRHRRSGASDASEE